MRQAEPLEKSAALYQKDLAATIVDAHWRKPDSAGAAYLQAPPAVDRSSPHL